MDSAGAWLYGRLMGYSYTSTHRQAATMQLLAESHPALLSRDEIRREIGDEIAVDDALAYLVRIGLVHYLEADDAEYFWVTRTGMAAEEAMTAPGPDSPP